MTTAIALLCFSIFTLITGVFIGAIFIFPFAFKRGVITSKQPPNNLHAALLAGLAILFGIASLFATIYSTYFIFQSEKSEAIVTEIRTTTGENGEIKRVPVYSYQDSTGKRYMDTTSMSVGREFAVGDKIPICYLTSDPHESRIDFFAYHWLMPLMLLFMTAVASFASAIFHWNYKRRLQQAG